MKTVLVTGGAGFIGSHLCEKLLELGNKVINLDNFNDSYSPRSKRKNIAKALLNPDYTLEVGDIRDSSLLKNIFSRHPIKTVVHLAALAGVRKSIETPLDYVDVDVKGTVNLLEASCKHEVEKFIFASSSSVYGGNTPPFKEESPLYLPMSPYAAAKLAGELFCATYNSLYKIPVVCLRFFTVYGPRQRPEMAIANFTKLILAGKEIPIFGSGKSERDYTYIDDIIAGIIKALDLQVNFEVFNLGSSTPIQLNQLINLLEHKIGKPALKRYLAAQKGDLECTCADLGKAKSMLGFEPQVSIEKGLARFVHWYRNAHHSQL